MSIFRCVWGKNNGRKGSLNCVNKYIQLTTPHSSTENIYNLVHKPLRLHTTIQFTPKYFHNKFNNCNDDHIKIKVPTHKIKLGDVGYKFENTLLIMVCSIVV